MKKLAIPLLLLVVALGGCGGTDDTSAAPAPSKSADKITQLRAYAKCMRENGVDMPDPDGDGVLRAPAMKAGAPVDKKMEAASEKCLPLLPADVGGAPQKMTPEDLAKARAQAKCMRENGVPDYPDPDPETGAIALPEKQMDVSKLQSAGKKCGGDSASFTAPLVRGK
ncbi:hypothetical protein [Actinoplanes sp. NPDC049265]|uniref:hypothetical protein n=1 Tax=Actinoplanes sp. NPDC049265 TaxID=3363902 RepID=UPI003716265F